MNLATAIWSLALLIQGPDETVLKDATLATNLQTLSQCTMAMGGSIRDAQGAGWSIVTIDVTDTGAYTLMVQDDKIATILCLEQVET